jgi:hypothetical protein
VIEKLGYILEPKLKDTTEIVKHSLVLNCSNANENASQIMKIIQNSLGRSDHKRITLFEPLHRLSISCQLAVRYLIKIHITIPMLPTLLLQIAGCIYCLLFQTVPSMLKGKDFSRVYDTAFFGIQLCRTGLHHRPSSEKQF